jgi:hypothetical protein
MARKHPPGSRKKVTAQQALEIINLETSEVTHRIYPSPPGERRNIVYVEQLKPYARSRVVRRKA